METLCTNQTVVEVIDPHFDCFVWSSSFDFVLSLWWTFSVYMTFGVYLQIKTELIIYKILLLTSCVENQNQRKFLTELTKQQHAIGLYCTDIRFVWSAQKRQLSTLVDWWRHFRSITPSSGRFVNIQKITKYWNFDTQFSSNRNSRSRRWIDWWRYFRSTTPPNGLFAKRTKRSIEISTQISQSLRNWGHWIDG
jgi:hypothetical protein